MCFDIRSWDQFGFNIQLNYRKKNSYGTRVGGICTIILQGFFWSMCLSLLIQIIFWPSFDANRYT